MTEDDKKFLEDFENCLLPEVEWTHRAHIRVAWLYLMHLRPDDALDKIRRGILRYNTVVLNRRIQYHETVTVAFTRIIAERMKSSATWHEFEQQNEDLFEQGIKVLLRYYSEGRLEEDESRQGFVEPDLKDLPAFL